MQIDLVAVLHGDFFSSLLLNDAEVGEFVHCDEGDSIAWGPSSASSADAVDVIFWRTRKFVVDDAGECVDVDSTS